jgi:hypothetical protein
MGPSAHAGLPALYGASAALEKACGPSDEPGALKPISTAVPKCSASVRVLQLGLPLYRQGVDRLIGDLAAYLRRAPAMRSSR